MDIHLNRGGQGPQLPPNAPVMIMIPGVLLMLLGVLIIYNPELVAYMVAGIFLLLGLLMLTAGWRLYQRLQ